MEFRSKLNGEVFIFPLINSALPEEFLGSVTNIAVTRFVHYQDGSTRTDVVPSGEYTFSESVAGTGLYKLSLNSPNWDLNGASPINLEIPAIIKITGPGFQDTSILIKNHANANMVAINDNSTSDNSAELKLKSLDIRNDGGDAVYLLSSFFGGNGLHVDSVLGSAVKMNGQDGEGLIIIGQGTDNNGIVVTSNDGDALMLIGSPSGKDISAKEIDSILADTDYISNNQNDYKADVSNLALESTSQAVLSDTDYISNNQSDYKADVSNLALESTSQSILSAIGNIDALSLDSVVDGVTLRKIFELSMAMVDGRYKIDTPTTGSITFYKRDNVTVLTVVNVTDGERVRL